MPEGHTLHRLARALDRAYAGTAPVVSSPQGRFVEGAALLTGREVEAAEAWGKHLFVAFDGDRVLNVHLGLIGVFSVDRYFGLEPPPVGAVRVRLLNEDWVADLRGATTVRVITPDQVDAIVSALGPDPLRAGTPGNEPERSLVKLARTQRTVAELLMDQSVIAGVGNVYRSEVLWRHRVAPFTPGLKVKKRSWLTMWDDLVALMPIGVAFGQIITLEEQVERARVLLAVAAAPDPSVGLDQPDEDDDDDTVAEFDEADVAAAYDIPWAGAMEGERARRPAYESASPFPRRYAVYKRAGLPCPRCGSRIRTAVVVGRNLFWCGRCQRRH